MKVFNCELQIEEVEYDRYFDISLFPLPLDLNSWGCPLDECLEAVLQTNGVLWLFML